MADTKNKRTWISIIIAILIIMVIVGVAVIGSAVFYVRRHINTQFVATDVADAEFDRQIARFAGQQPLIELVGAQDEAVIRRPSATASRTELRSLRIVAFDARAGKLVHVDVPFWLLRLTPGKHFSFAGSPGVDLDTERLHLTVDDLERAGPCLVLDTRNRHDGGRVVVWTE